MRKLDIGSLPDRITVALIDGDRALISFRAMSGEEVGFELSPAQREALFRGLIGDLEG